MKKIALILFAVLISSVAYGQHHGGKHCDKELDKHPDISKIVNDLSATQKRKLDAVTKESRARVDELRKQQQSIHDSIHLFMDREGDQSRILFPLFDRETRLQNAISREMYTTKVRIDKILTKEQRQQLRQAKRNSHKR